MQRRGKTDIPTLIMVLTLMLFLQAAAWSDTIPKITVQTLAGSSFALPDDLKAAADILVVGFTQKAGSYTRPWTERLRQDFTGADGFAVYPVAVLAGVPGLFRPFALNSIRAGVPPEERGRFLIVSRDESAWRSLAGYRLPDDPYIIVLDRTGSVLARERSFPWYSLAMSAVLILASYNVLQTRAEP